MFPKARFGPWLFLCFVTLQATALAQISSLARRPLASNILVPQARARALQPSGAVQVTAVDVGVVILEQVATTTMDISLRNPSTSRQEAELIIPVPDGAVVRTFTFQGEAKESTAELLAREEARRVYDTIVRKLRDPALLEFLGYNVVRTSLFPVEAEGTQKVRLTYEHLLPADGDRVDYVLTRTESVDYRVPWNVTVRVRAKRPISTVYSSSHELTVVRSGENSLSARISSESVTEPGPFRLSYLLDRGGVTASLFAYPGPEPEEGYFLVLGGLPPRSSQGEEGPAIRRDVTLVIDRSGSMNGEKLDQARSAALQVLAGLEDGETFTIIAYNEAVDVFSEEPVVKTKESTRAARGYLNRIKARGGTNIYDALVEATRRRPAPDTLPIVLFLTDGLPTTGQTSERAIRDVAIKANPHKKRVFTFGVGVDVNTPLLEKIAWETRATATIVLPEEDVEVKVADVFKRLAGPVLADPTLTVVGPEGKSPATPRVRDIVPGKLRDLFEGDQLVVLGRYSGTEPINFQIGGNYLGKRRTFEFTFSLDRATTRNAFVPRLWASRKIAFLVDAIRQLGADGGGLSPHGDVRVEPKLKELVEEVVRLSTEFGVLTEYTAFLAREGTDLRQLDQILVEARGNFVNRALACRSGLASANQTFNGGFQREQNRLNFRNGFLDANLQRVEVTSVQQMCDLAFYRKGTRWVDSRALRNEEEVKPEKVVEFGSEEFRSLALRLAGEGRQGCVALRGDILLVVDGQPVLVKSPQ